MRKSRVYIYIANILLALLFFAGFVFALSETYTVENLPTIEVCYEEPNAPKEATVCINGVNLTGVYCGTTDSVYSNHLQRSYWTKENARPVAQFELDENGRLLNLWLIDKNRNPDRTYSLEECEEIAREFLSNYTDVDEYVLARAEKDDVRCYFEFKKRIAGLKTTDFASVHVRCDGVVDNFSSHSLGEIPADTKALFFKLSADIAVMKKLNSYYQSIIEPYYGFTNMETNYVWFPLENGEIALSCYAESSLKGREDLCSCRGNVRFVVTQTRPQKMVMYIIIAVAGAVFLVVGTRGVILIRKRRAAKKAAQINALSDEKQDQ